MNDRDRLGQDTVMVMERETLKKVHQIDLVIHWMWGWAQGCEEESVKDKSEVSSWGD